MDGCDFTFFNTISVISGQLEGDYESLCGMKPLLGLESFLNPAGLKPVTASSAAQHLSY